MSRHERRSGTIGFQIDADETEVCVPDLKRSHRSALVADHRQLPTSAIVHSAIAYHSRVHQIDALHTCLIWVSTFDISGMMRV